MLLKLDSIHDKNNGEQFYAKACREYTLPRNDGSSQPKGWIQGNTKVGPVLEVTTSCLYGKHGVGIHYIAARPISPKVHEQNGRTRTISQEELYLCRCPMTPYGELKTMKRNVLLITHLCLYSQKDFQQEVGHSSDLDQKQSGILLTMKDLVENGITSLN